MNDERALLLQLACRKEMVDDILKSLPINLSSTISDNKIRFDTYEHKSNAYTLDLSTLYYYNFRDNKKGSLLDLVSELCSRSKSELMMELYLAICTTGELEIIEDLEDYNTEYKLEYPEGYPEDALSDCPMMCSRLFLEDNVWLTTQHHWGIRYDYRAKRVIIPVYQDNELVGAIGRFNSKELDKSVNKYFPKLTYSKSQVLFGLDEYRDKIKECKTVILVESEKSPMKAWQLRYKTPVLAIGGSNVSRHHIERLNILGVENLMLALDKGIECKEVLDNNIARLLRFSTAKNIYILDSDSCDLLDDKECVFDKTDINVIDDIIKNYSKKVR